MVGLSILSFINQVHHPSNNNSVYFFFLVKFIDLLALPVGDQNWRESLCEKGKIKLFLPVSFLQAIQASSFRKAPWQVNDLLRLK